MNRYTIFWFILSLITIGVFLSIGYEVLDGGEVNYILSGIGISTFGLTLLFRYKSKKFKKQYPNGKPRKIISSIEKKRKKLSFLILLSNICLDLAICAIVIAGFCLFMPMGGLGTNTTSLWNYFNDVLIQVVVDSEFSNLNVEAFKFRFWLCIGISIVLLLSWIILKSLIKNRENNISTDSSDNTLH